MRATGDRGGFGRRDHAVGGWKRQWRACWLEGPSGQLFNQVRSTQSGQAPSGVGAGPGRSLELGMRDKALDRAGRWRPSTNLSGTRASRKLDLSDQSGALSRSAPSTPPARLRIARLAPAGSRRLLTWLNSFLDLRGAHAAGSARARRAPHGRTRPSLPALIEARTASIHPAPQADILSGRARTSTWRRTNE